mmetsp:Transcript_7203/g.14628  ORF Transcript_7203/g.14628 Transcript_7203/m.14628 type:complete len:339 (-) Transcript_7203:410-1426(-)
MVLLHPVLQAVHDHLGHDRVVAVHRVAAPAVILHLHIGVGVEHVVGLGVDAAEPDHVGALVAALRSVVVHHIQDHLNVFGVALPHHLLELQRCRPRTRARRCVPRHRREEAKGGVAPGVDHVHAVVGGALELHLVELVHRQQLHRVDAQIHQVVQLGGEAEVGPLQVLPQEGGVAGGEAAHRRLVDDQVRQVVVGALVVRAPVEGGLKVVRAPPAVVAAIGPPLAVLRSAGHQRRVRVQQKLGVVPAVAVLPPAIAVDAVRVTHFRHWQPRHEHVPVVAGALAGELPHLALVAHQEAQRDNRGVLGGDGKVHTGLISIRRRSQGGSTARRVRIFVRGA